MPFLLTFSDQKNPALRIKVVKYLSKLMIYSKKLFFLSNFVSGFCFPGSDKNKKAWAFLMIIKKDQI